MQLVTVGLLLCQHTISLSSISNIDADALSRNPLPEDEAEWHHMPPESVKALCKQVTCGKLSEGSLNYAKPLGISPEATPEPMLAMPIAMLSPLIWTSDA